MRCITKNNSKRTKGGKFCPLAVIISRDFVFSDHAAPAELGEIRLQLNALSKKSDDPFGTDLDNIDVELRSGEILGIAGVSGNGQQELLYALSDEVPVDEVHEEVLRAAFEGAVADDELVLAVAVHVPCAEADVVGLERDRRSEVVLANEELLLVLVE